jgi:long-chain acyl-CoA synthetase
MRTWYVWPDEDFPRTSTLKPRRNVVQQAVLANKAGGSAGSSSNPLSELIAQITGRASSTESPNSNLESDLNLSSLDRVELLGALEDRYQIDLGESSLASIKTVGDLERMLRGDAPPRTHYHYPGWVQRRPITWVRLCAQYLLLRPAVFLLGRPRVKGKENVAGTHGPVLLICNHISDVDFALVLASIPARLANRVAIATAGETLEALRTPPGRNIWVGIYDRVKWFLAVSLFNLFPLPREAGFRESFAYAGQSVDRGYSILVFPEGRHTEDGALRPFKSGIGLLANNLGIPIVPMRIDGLFSLNQQGRKFAHPGQIQVRIGEPALAPDRSPEAIAQDLWDKVQEL